MFKHIMPCDIKVRKTKTDELNEDMGILSLCMWYKDSMEHEAAKLMEIPLWKIQFQVYILYSNKYQGDYQQGFASIW